MLSIQHNITCLLILYIILFLHLRNIIYNQKFTTIKYDYFTVYTYDFVLFHAVFCLVATLISKYYVNSRTQPSSTINS